MVRDSEQIEELVSQSVNNMAFKLCVWSTYLIYFISGLERKVWREGQTEILHYRLIDWFVYYTDIVHNWIFHSYHFYKLYPAHEAYKSVKEECII